MLVVRTLYENILYKYNMNIIDIVIEIEEYVLFLNR